MSLVIVTITVLALAGVLLRPRGWPEAWWPCAGASVLLVLRIVTPRAALQAVLQCSDVYLFLAGMMLLAEVARREGVFDWLASLAVKASKGREPRLFILIYLIGTLVTVFLSNDATAIVLTPAVAAAAKKARVQPVPYLFVCAFIANAASFVLPISNPANLVVYGQDLPSLANWLRVFLAPSAVSIGVTYFLVRLRFRKEIGGAMQAPILDVTRPANSAFAKWALLFSALTMIVASATGTNLGVATSAAAVLTLLAVTKGRYSAMANALSHVSWSVLPLVAGLFVLVAGLSAAGTLSEAGKLLEGLAYMPTWAGSLAASFGIAGLSNVMNNLPAALVVRSSSEALRLPGNIRPALLIGIDLGPNLSVTGSLATMLWLTALRREGLNVSGWRFLKLGALVMPPALGLTILAAAALNR